MTRLNHFKKMTQDIRLHKNFQSMKHYRQHQKSLYSHSIHVAYGTYLWAIRLNLDYKSATKGALLHDYFLYDWRKEGHHKKIPLMKKHGFTHPRLSLVNAKRDFGVNPIEEDIILHHMFPLTLTPPKTREGWLVNIMDTLITFYEFMPCYSNPVTKP